MIEDQELRLDGVRYLWQNDGGQGSSGNGWWVTADRYMKPPISTQTQLNRLFIDERARDIVASLEKAELDRFHDILKAMGATEEQLEAVFGDDPDHWPPKMATPAKKLSAKMPAAAHTPFNSPPVRNWFFGELLRTARSPMPLPTEVGMVGCGPFEAADFEDFLRRHGVVPHEVDEDTGVVVLGREKWSEREVDLAIDLRVGQMLKIYSQEMFVSFMAARSDPFYAGNLVLEAFKAKHKGLEFVSHGWAGWITTYVPEDRRSSRHRRGPSERGSPPGTAQVDESPLSVLGYHVGQTGVDRSTRHTILARAFDGELPVVGSWEYMAAWGERRTPERLKKIADNIAAYCRGQRTRANRSEEAIEDWESDLAWLKEKFYNGHFRFSWPAMEVEV